MLGKSPAAQPLKTNVNNSNSVLNTSLDFLKRPLATSNRDDGNSSISSESDDDSTVSSVDGGAQLKNGKDLTTSILMSSTPLSKLNNVSAGVAGNSIHKKKEEAKLSSRGKDETASEAEDDDDKEDDIGEIRNLPNVNNKANTPRRTEPSRRLRSNSKAGEGSTTNKEVLNGKPTVTNKDLMKGGSQPKNKKNNNSSSVSLRNLIGSQPVSKDTEDLVIFQKPAPLPPPTPSPVKKDERNLNVQQKEETKNKGKPTNNKEGTKPNPNKRNATKAELSQSSSNQVKEDNAKVNGKVPVPVTGPLTANSKGNKKPRTN
jgi:hypothetical protein